MMNVHELDMGGEKMRLRASMAGENAAARKMCTAV
jgi:hypothetical protein